MDSFKNNRARGAHRKERKLSFSFLRKSLSLKANPTADGGPLPNDSCSPKDENGIVCTESRSQPDKGRKNLLRRMKKKFQQRESFFIWKSKQKVIASESGDESGGIAFARALGGPSGQMDQVAAPLALGGCERVTHPLTAAELPYVMAVPASQVSRVSQAMRGLSREGWYWGPVGRQDAEEMLREQPDGTFLVRDSNSHNYLFTISFRSSGKTLHSRIDYDYKSGRFSLYSSSGFPSVAELIRHSMSKSHGAVYCYSQPNSCTQPEFPVRLTAPLSRFRQVHSLQHLCRFVIREYTCVANIHKLPLPPQIKGYIQEGYF